MKIKALEGCVVIKTEKVETVSISGIVKSLKDDERSQTGVVISVGSKVKEIKIGDRVVYQSSSGTKLKVDEVEYTFIEYEKVFAVLE